MMSPTDGARPTVILGGGLTGISAALHLRAPYLLFERDERLGGLARTETRDGFSFDRTGHWLHLRDPEIQALVAKVHGVPGAPTSALVEVAREARIFSHGRTTLYPFQANLHGLPPDVIHECLLGFFEAQIQRGDAPPKNFEAYILHHFGAGIAKHFMVPYNEKLWGVKVRDITSAWCSRFVPLPDVSQVIAGAVGAGAERLGYNVRFLYPKVGGIEAFTAGLVQTLDPARTHLRTAPDAIDAAARTLEVGGERVVYHALISSIPLPELISLLKEPPKEVIDAAARLRATAVRYLNVGTRRPSPAAWHWIYVPEPRLPFFRVGVYSNAVTSMAPAGGSSFYVELASRDPLTEAGTRDVLAALVEIGAISSVDDVLFADERVIDPAYVVFDTHYAEATQTLHAYLETQRIFSRGRYGAWIYNAMEDSLIAGKDIAAHVMALPREEPTSIVPSRDRP